MTAVYIVKLVYLTNWIELRICCLMTPETLAIAHTTGVSSSLCIVSRDCVLELPQEISAQKADIADSPSRRLIMLCVLRLDATRDKCLLQL
jgi:hypothetical protein